MKRLFLLALFIVSMSVANAQIVTTQDVDNAIAELYGSQPKNGKEYMILADRLVAEYPLDQNQQLSFTTIIQAPGKTKDELFIALNSWFVASFNSGKSVVQMVDKEQGIILAKGYLSGVGESLGFMKSVVVGEYVVIRLDIKDEKIRLITSIQEYYMDTSAGVGQMLFGGAVLSDTEIPVYMGYPFEKQKNKMYKKECAIGYVGGILYSKILVDKIDKAINMGIVGTESQDW